MDRAAFPPAIDPSRLIVAPMPKVACRRLVDSSPHVFQMAIQMTVRIAEKKKRWLDTGRDLTSRDSGPLAWVRTTLVQRDGNRLLRTRADVEVRVGDARGV